jgi:hypothetical protein
MIGAASGTSRRAFLGRAAGAAAVVAGAGVGAGALARNAGAAGQRTYTAGNFALELDGVSCGKLVGVDGGLREGNVIDEGQAPGDTIHPKHISGVKYEDFTLQVGSGMGKGMYNWIKDSFDKGVVRKNGAIIAADFNYVEKSRRTASQAFISSVTVPALDATAKDPAYIAVSLACDKVTPVKPTGQVVQGQKQKAWIPSNYVFEIDGANTKRVASIDSFTWKCRLASNGSFGIEIDDIAVTFPKEDLSSWQQWYNNLVGGEADERDGALTLIGADDGAVVTFVLSNLGLYRLRPAQGAAGRIKAEMYCERMRLLPTVNK